VKIGHVGQVKIGLSKVKTGKAKLGHVNKAKTGGGGGERPCREVKTGGVNSGHVNKVKIEKK
jgi:hypothetical protein